MRIYRVRYAIPGGKLVLTFRCEADDYDHAVEQFRSAEPRMILVNVEEESRRAADHKAYH